MNDPIDDFAALVEQAGRFHGHVCAGIEIGTRMALTGMRRIGIADPRGADRKKLLVFVEIDRCATDAIMSATGCSPGKRSLKVLDYGKMAATFMNLETSRAVRLAAVAPRDEGQQQLDFATVPDEQLFSITDVEVALRPEDLPGKPMRTSRCEGCGERVLDGRELPHQGRTLCRSCFEERRYYRPLAIGAGAR